MADKKPTLQLTPEEEKKVAQAELAQMYHFSLKKEKEGYALEGKLRADYIHSATSGNYIHNTMDMLKTLGVKAENGSTRLSGNYARPNEVVVNGMNRNDYSKAGNIDIGTERVIDFVEATGVNFAGKEHIAAFNKPKEFGINGKSPQELVDGVRKNSATR